MEGTHYFIHDLLEIHASSRLNQDIIKMLDFQLGSLKGTYGDHPADNKIIIKPYDEFEFKQGAPIVYLWKTSGVTGHSFNNPEGELALARSENTLVIYANRRNFSINMFIQSMLVGRGVSLLPAAGIVDKGRKATLVAGAGGAGKTTITLSAVKSGKYCLLGDDTICITSDGYGLSYPREFTLKDYHRPTFSEYFSVSKKSNARGSISFTKYFIKQIIHNMPFLGLLNSLLQKLGQPDLQKKLIPKYSTRRQNKVLCSVPLEKIYGQDKIIPRANIDRIIYLERYNGDSFATTPMDPEILAARLCALLNNEWALSARRLCLISVLELVDFREYVSLTMEIIFEGIKNRQCECLWIPNNCTPEALSSYYLSHYSD